MKKQTKSPLFSGASPEKVAEDLKPLVDFQDEGLSLPVLRQLLEKRLFPHLMNYELPEFQSMFNFFPEEGAKFGAIIALQFNQSVTNWQVSPGGAVLEELCCGSLCRLFGLGPDSDATFMYCGTYANQQALYMALHRKAEEQGFDFSRKGLLGFNDPANLVILTSEDAHFSIRHAVRMLGLGEENIFHLFVDKKRRIDLEKMKKTFTELKDRKDIFCVVATAGTTSAGSVDPIQPLAQACQESGIWLHVDGAYGLAYCLVPEWEPLFAGRELADSISWDPHKQFGVPIPSSILFVKRKVAFERMALHSDYFNPAEDPKPNPGLKSPPSTRPLSVLALVTSLLYQGKKKVIERLRAPLRAIKEAADRLHDEPGIELSHSPDTGILCFRIVPDGFPQDKLDDLQEYIYAKVMQEGKRTVSKTKLSGQSVLRLVAVSPIISSKNLMETIDHARTIGMAYDRM
jgi:glutamate/tyrosine decarboxylase-like PLP-dependent enzyme